MDERLERYAELVVRVGANVQPGQEVFLLPKVEHCRARPRPRAPGVQGRRVVRPRPLSGQPRAEGDDRARARRGAHVLARVAEDVLPLDERQRDARDDGRSRAGAALRPRRRAGWAGGAARGRADPDAADRREQRQLVRSRRSDRGLGEAGLRRARRRAALGEGRVLHAPRRARPGRGLARAHRPAQGAGRDAERPSSGCSPLSRPRHRPHGRTAPGRALARRRQ